LRKEKVLAYDHIKGDHIIMPIRGGGGEGQVVCCELHKQNGKRGYGRPGKEQEKKVLGLKRGQPGRGEPVSGKKEGGRKVLRWGSEWFSDRRKGTIGAKKTTGHSLY